MKFTIKTNHEAIDQKATLKIYWENVLLVSHALTELDTPVELKVDVEITNPLILRFIIMDKNLKPLNEEYRIDDGDVVEILPEYEEAYKRSIQKETRLSPKQQRLNELQEEIENLKKEIDEESPAMVIRGMLNDGVLFKRFDAWMKDDEENFRILKNASFPIIFNGIEFQREIKSGGGCGMGAFPEVITVYASRLIK